MSWVVLSGNRAPAGYRPRREILQRAWEWKDPKERQYREAGFDLHHPRVRKFFELYRMAQDLPGRLGQHSGGMVPGAGRDDAAGEIGALNGVDEIHRRKALWQAQRAALPAGPLPSPLARMEVEERLWADCRLTPIAVARDRAAAAGEPFVVIDGVLHNSMG